MRDTTTIIEEADFGGLGEKHLWKVGALFLNKLVLLDPAGANGEAASEGRHACAQV